METQMIDGLNCIVTRFGPRETMDRLEAEIRSLGMEIFARIDHAAGAAKVGMELLPTEVIIFGNARAGTPLMRIKPTVAFDLPLKALVWQDAAGVTRIAYRDTAWLAQQHGLGSKADDIVVRMNASLDAVSREAAGECCEPASESSSS